MSPQSTITTAIITATPASRHGFAFADRDVHRSPSSSSERRGDDSCEDQQDADRFHAQRRVCPDRSRAAATPEATSASAVRSHARYVRSFASWNCTSGSRRSLMLAPPREMARA